MLDNTLKTIQQTQRSVEMAIEEPTIENLVQQAEGTTAQSLELVLLMNSSVSMLQAKIKEHAPQWLGMSHMFVLGACWSRVPWGTIFYVILYKFCVCDWVKGFGVGQVPNFYVNGFKGKIVGLKTWFETIVSMR